MKFLGTDIERDVRASMMSYLPKYYEMSAVANEIMRVDGEEMEVLFDEIQSVLDQFFITKTDKAVDKWISEFAIPQPGLVFKQTAEATTLNFDGKIQGSFAENVNKYTRRANATIILPSHRNDGAQSYEPTTPDLQKIYSKNGVLENNGNSTNGVIYSTMFSFDLISHIEKAYKWTIPGSGTAEKVAWLKANLTSYDFYYYGYGSGPSGNKVTVQRWAANSQVWYGGVSHTQGTVQELITGTANMNEIESDGWVHFVANADAANGTVESRVATDYVELVVKFKWERYEDYNRTQDEKRALLLLQLRSLGTVTKQLLKEMCMLYDGGETEIIEDNAKGMITIRFTSVFGTPLRIKDLTVALRNIIPAHLDFKYEYRYTNWNEIDTANNTWNTIDSKLLLWENVDSGGLIK